MKTIEEVKKLRKKIFECTKYIEYENTFNELMIPEEFNPDDCIPVCYTKENYNDICKYSFGKYKELYEKAKNSINTNGIIKDNSIFVVHPFYPILRHANFLCNNEIFLKEYKEYYNVYRGL